MNPNEIQKVIDMTKEMFDLQRKFDQHVFDNDNNVECYDDIFDRNLAMAILDEVGEVNHELKKEWCYWKKSQKPVNREKLLEELVDVLHFILQEKIKHKTIRGSLTHLRFRLENDCLLDIHIFDLVPFQNENGIDDSTLIFPALDWFYSCAVNKLGFTWQEVYEAYKKKNAENHKRQENGY